MGATRLTLQAMKKLPQTLQRCLNLQYTDEHSSLIQGTVSTVVRNKLTRKLYFQTWNHVQSTSAPTSPSDFNFINADHSIRNYTWRISKQTANAIIQQLTALSDEHCANSAEIVNEQYTTMHNNHSMNTAMDMNADGSPLTSSSTLKGPDAAKWLKAHGEEIVTLLESGTGRFIQRLDMPTDLKAAYYNPQPTIKNQT